MPGINSLPTAEVRTEIIDKLSMFISAIETHPEWKPTPNPSLHHVWDFVQRTRYMMTELDNIEAGRPLQHPEQLPMKSTSGRAAALECYGDVFTRSLTIEMLLRDPVKMVFIGMAPMDVGADIKAKAKDVLDCLQQH